MRTPGVYAIVNTLNDRRYVGSSVDVAMRWSKHRCDLRQRRHHSPELQRAWDEHGEAMFAFVILDVVKDFSARLIREQLRLDETAEPYNLINTAFVKCVPGTVERSVETRRRLSSAMLGRPKSPEHRAAISAAKRGKKNPKHAAALRGRKLSPETREKMRIAHTGLKGTPESRAKQSARLKGRIFTPEWKARISAAKRGKPWSERNRTAHRAAQASGSASAVTTSEASEQTPHDHIIH